MSENLRLNCLRVCLGVTCLFVEAAQGLVIDATFVDAAGESWNSDPARKAVIDLAIADWQEAILDDHTVEITFTFAAAGSAYLGKWRGSGAFTRGTDIYPWTEGISHTITFNADLFSGDNYLWWDPTPQTRGDQPTASWDALSVARHELGHAMGFTDGLYLDNFDTPVETNRWLEHIAGGVFDPGGLDVTMDGFSHVANFGSSMGDLMVASLPNRVRREISRTDLKMLALAHGYDVVLPVILGDMDESGSVNNNDITPFVMALTDRATYIATYGLDPDVVGDIDGSGALNNNDITPFVNLLTGGPQVLPEPGALWLLALGGLATIRRRRK